MSNAYKVDVFPQEKMGFSSPLPDKPLGQYTPTEMRAAIASLVPKKDLTAGIRQLNNVLSERGVPGVLEYVTLARQVIANEGKVLEMDFTHRKLKAYKNTAATARTGALEIHRRNFLGITGCAVSGAIFGAWGGLKTADQLTGYAVAEDEKEEMKHAHKHPLRKTLTKAYEVVDDHLMGPAELLVGAVLIEEAIHKWREKKREAEIDDFEQMSNAAVVFGDLVDADQKKFASCSPAV